MKYRVGFGTDIHRMERGDGIRLGGVFIPCEFGMSAHSDGDVLLHAVIDALLGACGWGDIGEWFPPDRTESGIASGILVAEVVEKIAARGRAIVNVDCVIDLERPKLLPWKPAMRKKLAELLRINEADVNVKAKTAEGLGAIGKAAAAGAQAIALVSLP